VWEKNLPDVRIKSDDKNRIPNVKNYLDSSYYILLQRFFSGLQAALISIWLSSDGILYGRDSRKFAADYLFSLLNKNLLITFL